MTSAAPARPVGPGLAKARRARLPQRIARPQCVLTRHAEETIFAVAKRMTEGSVREGADGDTYFGSTMLTIDLERLATQWRGPVQGERIVEAMAGSVRARLRCMRLACADATSRHPDRCFGLPLVETRVVLVDGAIHIDVDVEAPLLAREAQTRR